MRIITPGKLPQERIYRATCLSCGCRFEFARAEALYVHDQRDGDALVVKCPTPGCNKEEWVTP